MKQYVETTNIGPGQKLFLETTQNKHVAYKSYALQEQDHNR